MTISKPPSSIPYFVLAALWALVPVLNNKYPPLFFPSFSPWWMEVFSTFAGIVAATMAFFRYWAFLEKRSQARSWVMEANMSRLKTKSQDPNDISSAGRSISRLVQHSTEDLKEIKPDFTLVSLQRLQTYLPELLLEVENQQDAFIHIGIVGTYLGETLCRNLEWKWFFQGDPELKQFSFLCSVLRNQKGEEIDPFAWAHLLLIGKNKMGSLLCQIQK